jgi:GT2 family glycosyltransferase
MPDWVQTALAADPAAIITLRSLLLRSFRAGDRSAPLVAEYDRRMGPTRPHSFTTGLTSIIVPVRGAHEALKLCLECVDAHTRGSYELIIVCPGDEGAAVEELAPTGAIVRGTYAPVGFPAACNVGAQVARGDRLVFLNSDAFVGPGWLERLLSPWTDHPEGGTGIVAVGPMGTNVSGHQHVDSSKPVPPIADIAAVTADWSAVKRSLRRDDVYFARRLVGFCIAIDRWAFHDVGGWYEEWPVPLGNYDDDYMSLVLTLLAGPRALAVVPDLLVLHQGSASFAALPDADRVYREALTKNREHFESRWGWLLAAWDEWLTKEGVR